MSSSPAPSTWEAYARLLGVELHRLRLSLGLSQEDLAHRAGITRNYYQQLERGHIAQGQATNPSLKVIIRLASELGVPLSRLLPDPTDLSGP